MKPVRPPMPSFNADQANPSAMDCVEMPAEHQRRQVLLCKTVERNGRDWVAAVMAMQRLDAVFGAKLAACADAVAAAAICAEWLGHRLDSAVVAQHRLLEAWLEAVAEVGIDGIQGEAKH